MTLIAASFALTACQSASSNAPPPVARMSDAQAFAAARAAVLADLRDPDSAKFGPIFAHKMVMGGLLGETTEEIICGTVNSRNGFGGYSGQTIFAYRVRTNIVLIDSTADFPGTAWCKWTPDAKESRS